MSFVAQRFHTGRVVGVVVFFWRLTLMGTSITQDFAGLVSVRFILGALMSVTSPAWVLITSIFYRREEQAFRVMFLVEYERLVPCRRWHHFFLLRLHRSQQYLVLEVE